MRMQAFSFRLGLSLDFLLVFCLSGWPPLIARQLTTSDKRHPGLGIGSGSPYIPWLARSNRPGSYDLTNHEAARICGRGCSPKRLNNNEFPSGPRFNRDARMVLIWAVVTCII